MKRLLLIVFLLVSGAVVHGRLQSDDQLAQVPPSRVAPLMRMKLEKAKQMLEGLALEDHVKVAASARSLKLLSLESGWNVLQTPEYTTQSKEFRHACDLIAQAAENKDNSRAALGYVALTVRCIECHAYMRKHRMDLATSDAGH